MTSKDLKAGCKVTITITQQAARQQHYGTEKATRYLSEIFDIKNDGTLVMPAPILHTRLVMLSTRLRYDFMFSTDDGFLIAHGSILSHYKQGNFFLMDVVLTSPLERFQRREYFRLDCSLPATCMALGDESFDPLQITDIRKYLLENVPDYVRMTEGTILNISGGGALYMTGRDFSGTEFILLRIVLHEGDGNTRQDSIDIIGRILEQTRNNDAGNYRYRIMFVFRNPRFREKIVQYVFEEQRRLRKKEQGI